MESYKRKKTQYVKKFFSKRILKTIVHFDLAVFAFIFLAFVLGRDYSWQQYALSLTGWTNVGNSNWFMFVIIALYIIAYVGLVIVERFHLAVKTFLWAIFVASLAFTLIMYKLRPLYWCDTIMAFPMGMLWSVYRNKLEDKLRDNSIYWTTLIFTIALFALLYWAGHKYIELFYFFSTGIFGIAVILISMRLKLGNAALYWLGTNAFAIYMLQRLPMIIATELGINKFPLLFMAVVIPITLLIAAGFTALTNRIDRKLFA